MILNMTIEMDEQSIAVRASNLRDEFARLELYRSMHAMTQVLQELGWELAEKEDSSQRELAGAYMGKKPRGRP